MQVFTQKRNPITGSTEWDAQHADYDYHQEIARSAFADMLHDSERNKKYQKALQLAIEKTHNLGKKANVLDIGTGTGLLSIMAVRCGADSVVACEAFKPMAECCAKILQKNNVADKVQLIHKRSTEIIVGEDGDMKEKANILVTEVFDTELIGEGALSTFSHAHKYLLEEGCIVVPDSAVIYAQVIESPTMQKWNKLQDLADEDLNIILKTPQKMKDCAGSAAVHDLQLSQLPRQAFRELSEQVAVFYYDWSGRAAVDMRRTVEQQLTATGTGQAQMVFMWWELNMDTEGKICLSCAPWWCHPDADKTAARPDDTIPWRDHWMQAIYYLPQEINVTKGSEITLVSCQDEYSLWFYLENQTNKQSHYTRPVCDCGVHMALSRTHVSYLNDSKRSKKFLSKIRHEIDDETVVLDLNGSSFLGLAASKMGAKEVYILESTKMHRNILEDYMKENDIKNVKIVSEVDNEIMADITTIICDPNFSSALLPWENLKMASTLFKLKDKIDDDMPIVPEVCEFWAMPVEFQNLHKIRIPLGKCENIDMSLFDKLVEDSRLISDSQIEAQPLWEYPCRSRGRPRRLLRLDLRHLSDTYTNDGTFPLRESVSEVVGNINGFAMWVVWKASGKDIKFGPLSRPVINERVNWDTHTRQAVKIMKKSHTVDVNDTWVYQVSCDLLRGYFEVDFQLVPN